MFSSRLQSAGRRGTRTERPEQNGSNIALDRQWAEGLAVRHHTDDVDRDVRWAGRDPVHRIRNIFRGERRGSGIHRLRALLIAGEPHVGELGPAAESGFDAARAHSSANQIGI